MGFDKEADKEGGRRVAIGVDGVFVIGEGREMV